MPPAKQDGGYREAFVFVLSPRNTRSITRQISRVNINRLPYCKYARDLIVPLSSTEPKQLLLPVFDVMIDLADVEQEPDTAQVALRRGQVQRRTPVVVAQVHVHPLLVGAEEQEGSWSRIS